MVSCHAHLDDSVEVCQFLDVIPLDCSGGGLLGSGQQPVAPQLLHDFGFHLWVLADGIQRPRRSVARRCKSHTGGTQLQQQVSPTLQVQKCCTTQRARQWALHANTLHCIGKTRTQSISSVLHQVRHICMQPRSQANCLNHAPYALVIVCIVICHAGSKIGSGLFLYGPRHQMHQGGKIFYIGEWENAAIKGVCALKAGHEEDGDLWQQPCILQRLPCTDSTRITSVRKPAHQWN